MTVLPNCEVTLNPVEDRNALTALLLYARLSGDMELYENCVNLALNIWHKQAGTAPVTITPQAYERISKEGYIKEYNEAIAVVLVPKEKGREYIFGIDGELREAK